MSRSIRALGRIKGFLSQNCKHWKQDVSYIEEDLKAGEKHKKFFEVIKSHAKENKHFKYLLYMAKYWEENKTEVTKELLENYDFPYTVEEFNFLKEELR